ncbi:MAG: alpha/beta hydrolase [Archangium sp.]
MKLHHELLSKPGAERVLVMLHGILGQGGNLRGLARQFIEAQSGWSAVLMDLRAHGSSQDAPGNADTVANAAADVTETLAALGLKPHAIVGHSFGGKVALALDAPHVMTLDSAPGARPDARGSESTAEVLQMLTSFKTGPWPTRDAYVEAVMQAGQSKMVAQWLAMNLDRRDDGMWFRLPMPRILTLIADYLNLDLWSAVEQPKPGRQYHLVVGTSSTVYDRDDILRAQELETNSQGRVTVDLLDAGHWIHVEAAAEVLATMQRRLVD